MRNSCARGSVIVGSTAVLVCSAVAANIPMPLTVDAMARVRGGTCYVNVVPNCPAPAAPGCNVNGYDVNINACTPATGMYKNQNTYNFTQTAQNGWTDYQIDERIACSD